MRLISLNTWGGRLYEPLLEFINREAETIDVFCFQEVFLSRTHSPQTSGIRQNLIAELKNALPNFLVFERPAVENNPTGIGEVIFYKNLLNVTDRGGFHTYREDDESITEKIKAVTGNFQFVKLARDDDTYLIGNLHGLWLPDSKWDTPKRIEQSNRLKDAMDAFRGKKILCGDFNLQPETESVALLEKDMRNLIKEYKVTTTRNHYYENMKKYSDYIADYIFVSPDVHVVDFKVLENEVSDHLPLFLEFD